jgi:hypothetical protein
MTDPRLWKIWGIAEANLKDARRFLLDTAPLAAEDTASLANFDEYLAHNELGLALEEIADIGSKYACAAAFWKRLEAAAEAMERRDSALLYRERFHAAVRRQ